MSPSYRYTPYIWPMLASAVFLAALGLYTWRRRSVPGAYALALSMLCGVVWAMGAAMELAAVDMPTKLFWFKVQGLCVLPSATAVLCFVLDYANLSRWLTRTTLMLLAVPPLLTAALMLTNGAHDLIWSAVSFRGYVQPQFGPGAWILVGYGYILALLQMGVLVWLFVRSPLHRWPVALILVSRLAMASAFLLEPLGRNPFAPMDAVVLAMTLTSAMYALALFRFRLLDLIPIAHETAIQQMREGLLILDPQLRVVDLNRSAERIVGARAPRPRGRSVAEILPELRDFWNPSDASGRTESEINLGAGPAARYYTLQFSPLQDRNGRALGQLLLLHDVTEQRRGREELLEQQRVVATLEERQRLARELHDSVGQMLGYVSMQAQAIRKWVHDGETATAEAQLARLAAAAQDAHDDIRESILSLKAGSASDWAFLDALRRYLAAFQDRCGIATDLVVTSGIGEQDFAPDAGVQLLRVIQEALTNARRHGHARCVSVALDRVDGQGRVVVDDDGCGFDPDQLSDGDGDHLGVAFMCERMAQIGGGVSIHSQPGAGTQVEIRVPIRDVAR